MSQKTASPALSIALVGIGGYGNHYVNTVLGETRRSDFRFIAAADPSPATCERLSQIESQKIPIYPSIEMLLEHHRPDLTVICSPLHLHANHSCLALDHGSHVLCEKPLCISPDQIRAMTAARDKAQRQVAIGYQWSFNAAIQALKADILAGALGKPKRLKSLVLWPRDERYYSRNRWAGAQKDPAGNWILDSPVNNACAHYLHNMLYLIGPAVDRSAMPRTVTAELYRANQISNYDTAALRVGTDGAVDLLFVVSHATASPRGPHFIFEFENATIEFSGHPDASIVARLTDGTTRSYGSPHDTRDRKLWSTLDAINQNKPTICGIEAASAHTHCAWAAQQSPAEIVPFPPSLIEVAGTSPDRRTSVSGLGKVLEKCYQEWKLPSEVGVEWAKPATPTRASIFPASKLGA